MSIHDWQREQDERLIDEIDRLAGIERACDTYIRSLKAQLTTADARIAELKSLVTEAVCVCDDLIEKTDIYLGINDAYKRHDLWEKRVQNMSKELK